MYRSLTFSEILPELHITRSLDNFLIANSRSEIDHQAEKLSEIALDVLQRTYNYEEREYLYQCYKKALIHRAQGRIKEAREGILRAFGYPWNLPARTVLKVIAQPPVHDPTVVDFRYAYRSFSSPHI
jgi:hypothetical protein